MKKKNFKLRLILKQKKITLFIHQNKVVEPYTHNTKRKTGFDNELTKIITTDLEPFKVIQNKVVGFIKNLDLRYSLSNRETKGIVK